jgi:hypothetical protein
MPLGVDRNIDSEGHFYFKQQGENQWMKIRAR